MGAVWAQIGTVQDNQAIARAGAEMLQAAGDDYLEAMASIFNEILAPNGEVPKDWQHSCSQPTASTCRSASWHSQPARFSYAEKS